MLIVKKIKNYTKYFIIIIYGQSCSSGCNSSTDIFPSSPAEAKKESTEILDSLTNNNSNSYGYKKFPFKDGDKKVLKDHLSNLYTRIDTKASFDNGKLNSKISQDILKSWGKLEISKKLEKMKRIELPKEVLHLYNQTYKEKTKLRLDTEYKIFSETENSVMISNQRTLSTTYSFEHWLKQQTLKTNFIQDLEAIPKIINNVNSLMCNDKESINKEMDKLNYSKDISKNNYDRIISMHIKAISKYYKSLNKFAKTPKDKNWIINTEKNELNFFSKLKTYTKKEDLKSIIIWLYAKKSLSLNPFHPMISDILLKFK